MFVSVLTVSLVIKKVKIGEVTDLLHTEQPVMGQTMVLLGAVQVLLLQR